MKALREPTPEEIKQVVNQKFKEVIKPSNVNRLIPQQSEAVLRPYDIMLRERQSMYAYDWLHKQDSFKRALERYRKAVQRAKNAASRGKGANSALLQERVEFSLENMFLFGYWGAIVERLKEAGPGYGPTAANRAKARAALKRVRNLIKKNVFRWDCADRLTQAIVAAESMLISIKHQPSQSLKSRLLRVVKDATGLFWGQCELKDPEIVRLFADLCGVECAIKTAESYIKAAQMKSRKESKGD